MQARRLSCTVSEILDITSVANRAKDSMNKLWQKLRQRLPVHPTAFMGLGSWTGFGALASAHKPPAEVSVPEHADGSGAGIYPVTIHLLRKATGTSAALLRLSVRPISYHFRTCPKLAGTHIIRRTRWGGSKLACSSPVLGWFLAVGKRMALQAWHDKLQQLLALHADYAVALRTCGGASCELLETRDAFCRACQTTLIASAPGTVMLAGRLISARSSDDRAVHSPEQPLLIDVLRLSPHSDKGTLRRCQVRAPKVRRSAKAMLPRWLKHATPHWCLGTAVDSRCSNVCGTLEALSHSLGDRASKVTFATNMQDHHSHT